VQDLFNWVEPADFGALNTTKKFGLATIDYGAHVLLPNLVKRLYREAPNISLELVPWKEGAQKMLAEDNIDLSTCTTDDLLAGIYSWNLGKDEFVCVMMQGHR
jgi:DNA-binding transcriptional LysR family regulator